MSADDTPRQAVQTNLTKGAKSNVNSGPTGFVRAYAWIYLILSVIVGLALIVKYAYRFNSQTLVF